MEDWENSLLGGTEKTKYTSKRDTEKEDLRKKGGRKTRETI